MECVSFASFRGRIGGLRDVLVVVLFTCTAVPLPGRLIKAGACPETRQLTGEGRPEPLMDVLNTMTQYHDSGFSTRHYNT